MNIKKSQLYTLLIIAMTVLLIVAIYFFYAYRVRVLDSKVSTQQVLP